MKDVLNDFKVCGRPMTKNELKIKELEEKLECEKSTSLELARRIIKIIEMFNGETLNKYYHGMSYEFEIDEFKEDILKILKGEE